MQRDEGDGDVQQDESQRVTGRRVETKNSSERLTHWEFSGLDMILGTLWWTCCNGVNHGWRFEGRRWKEE